MKPKRKEPRSNDLARIHILKNDLGLDDDQYRVVLWTVARAESSKDLDTHGRRKVIEHLQSHVAARNKAKPYPARPNNVDAKKRKELTKIEALLTDAGKPWSYAEGIMRRITYGRKQRLEFCSEGELAAIIGALERNAIKRLHGELEALFGEQWDMHAAHYAALLFDFDSQHQDITRYSQPMSAVARWWRGELQAVCAWPVVLGQSRCCAGCAWVAKGREVDVAP